ncbi:MAG TPA: hypothetical protein VGQ00_00535 [Candidatus Norongarragalinales archaeon]|jgi:ribosomal protein S24E|nr:hypothetical protein [Candidatus Norongarragalinales archaeon]
MKLNVTNKQQNQLFKRWEVQALANDFQAVPSRKEVAAELAKALNCPAECVVVGRVQGRQGAREASVTAHIYDTAEAAQKSEPAWKHERTAGKKKAEKKQ